MNGTPSPQLMRGGFNVTPQQAVIVDQVLGGGLTVVDAGAGSGKTRTTVAAVLELLERNPQLSIDRFVLITFTAAAAAELRDRLETALIDRESSAGSAAERARWAETRECLANAYLGTIHGFCNQVLRAYGYGAFVARESEVDFSSGLEYEAITDTLEQALAADPDHPLFAGLGTRWRRFELERIIRDILDDIRNRGLSPDEIAARTSAQPDDDGKPVRAALARLVANANQLYTEKKSVDQKVDAIDLLRKTAETLESDEGPTICARLGERYRYLFVDEFQDTDRIQMRIVDALRPRLAGVLLVGDDKQSIYGFRGAGMRLGQLATERGTTALPLNLSNRPTKRLLDLQNALFESLGGRYPELGNLLEAPDGAINGQSTYPSMIYFHVGDTDDVQIRIAATAEEIGRILSTQIDGRDGRDGLRPATPGDIAVLFRSNRMLETYAGELPALLPPGVEARKDTGGQFFRRSEVVGCYRMLRLIADPQNDVVLAQAAATPYLRVDAGPVVRGLLRSGPVNPKELTSWFEESHPEAAQKIRELRVDSRSDTVPELLERLYDQFAMREYHRARGEAGAVANLERLREMARDLTRSRQALTTPMFVRWLQSRFLAGADEPDALETGEGSGGPPYIRLMTIHKAKGLEFPVVIIPEVQTPVLGFSGELDFVVDEQWGLDVKLPLERPTQSPRFAQLTRRNDGAERAEAFRVFYVAVTRAQRAVVFVGSGPPGTTLQPTAPKYSWKDEIRLAWPGLQRLGAVVT